MISLTNAYLANQNKPPMGWVNPFLYQYSSKFFSDVTSGSNKGLSGSTNCYVCQYGYYAGVGWDPVSGLGTLNLQSFMYMASNITTAKPPSTLSSTATWVIVVAVIGALIVVASLVSIGYWFYTKRRTAAATVTINMINTPNPISTTTTTTTTTGSPLQHQV